MIKSIAFLQLSLIDVKSSKAHPLYIKQIVKENKTGCTKSKSKSKKRGEKGKVGRPKGKVCKYIECSYYSKNKYFNKW